jgi:hypothetical protein
VVVGVSDAGYNCVCDSPISYESGVDVHDFGLILKDCSIKEIQSAVRQISSLSAQELKKRAQKA